jgi:GTP-binding protein
MDDHEAHGREVTAVDAERIESARILFAQECRFVTGVASLDGLPADSLPEIAFAGRSNVGKSSLINALTGRKTLARTSNTPGRTRQLNFFDLGGRLMIVDLPGYGYARASKVEARAWTELTRDYLRGRAGLRRLCLLIDARHGLKPSDSDLMAMLAETAVPYRVILTKADKPKSAELAARRAEIEAVLRAHAAAMPDVLAASARKGSGIAELRADLATLAIDS